MAVEFGPVLAEGEGLGDAAVLATLRKWASGVELEVGGTASCAAHPPRRGAPPALFAADSGVNDTELGVDYWYVHVLEAMAARWHGSCSSNNPCGVGIT